MTGPFGSDAEDLARLGIAVLPLGGDQGKEPLVSGFGKWKRRPGGKHLAKLLQKFGDANIGALAHLSGVTIVDIDDAALIPAMLERYGDTPLQTQTPSGGVHLWYRHNGERCRNLRSEGLAVDIKGHGGYVVIPPSIRTSGPHVGKPYTFRRGDWGDLGSLPFMRCTETIHGGDSPKVVPLSRCTETIHGDVGTRNDRLFREVHGWAARNPGASPVAVRAFADQINARLRPPLPEAEVEKTANSIIKMRAEGRLWHADGKPRFAVSQDFLDQFEGDGNALMLMLTLILAHGARKEPFAISDAGMTAAEVIPGWRREKYRNAKGALLSYGMLRIVHKATGKIGDCNTYDLTTVYGNHTEYNYTLAPLSPPPPDTPLGAPSSPSRDASSVPVSDGNSLPSSLAQLDLVEFLGGPSTTASTEDQLREDAKGKLIGEARGTQKRLALTLGLSPCHLSNFLAGKFGLNDTAARALREWIDGNLSIGGEAA
ncbi:conserved hypothetical protein [uncultured Alphaproteobacteria bacterium]|uniref:DNA primase/polymerase bifunctional N-terminal domain-containing protein n=1 Tax=uncultured Alphaproteobacteria bacterium TaxID=91750 RepID=A0A212K260_9PROT|nr:conserved hypothetical protein [uncultured Alphaproteobacteria bacterium]